MKNGKWVAAAVAASLAFTLSSPASAGNSGLGAVVGGVAGAAIGHSMNGSDGAVIGGILGAAIGASAASQREHRHYSQAHPSAYAYHQPQPVHYMGRPAAHHPAVVVTGRAHRGGHDGPRYGRHYGHYQHPYAAHAPNTSHGGRHGRR